LVPYFFKESRIEETQVPVLQRIQNRRNTGSSSSKIPEPKKTWVPVLQRHQDQRIPDSKKHGFQFFNDTRIKETPLRVL
jgi:hypothetical protein